MCPTTGSGETDSESRDDDVFAELLHSLARTPDVVGARRPLDVGSLLANRFELLAPLGRGGMGRVYEAFDRKLNIRVALKVVGDLTPRAIVHFKREFRSAAELDHENLVRHYELFCDGSEWFFTMELVEGVTLRALWKQRRLPQEPELRALFGQLARALLELHASGTVHGDLKPSNFLIDGSGRLVLLDFGIARPLLAGPEVYGRAGTPGYMSPEQTSGLALTEASDWYSFGKVLQEQLKELSPAERPADFAPALQTLCTRLLASDPRARPGGEQVVQLLGGNNVARRSEPPIAHQLLVGRGHELQLLRSALAASREQRQPMVALVSGTSGVGKTTLLEHFAREVRAQGGLVLAGRCRERESVGHKSLDSIIDGLVAWLDAQPHGEAVTLLPSAIGDLTRLFPALRAAASVAHAPKQPTPTADQGVAKQRAVGAFRELLANLARRGPLVLWIDDLQWSDAESATLLEPVLSPDGGLPVLFVGCSRPNESQGPALLRALYEEPTSVCPAPCQISLGLLSARESVELASALLSSETANVAALAEAIAREAQGLPLFIAELSQSAQSYRDSDRLPNMTELIEQRLANLAPPTRRLLELLALAGAPLSRRALRLAQSIDAMGAEEALRTLRNNRLIRTSGASDESELAVVHDRIRDLIVERVSAPDTTALHLSLARALEVQNHERPDLIASHFLAGGERNSAGRYFIQAGDRAAETFAFARAAELYASGVEYAQLGSQQRHEIRLREAEARAHAGQGEAAANLYLEEASTRSREQQVRLTRLAAEQLLLCGHLERGLATIDNVLAALDMPKMRSGKWLLSSVVLGRARVRMRGFSHKERPEHTLSERELARIDAARTVAISLGAVDFMRGADLQNQHLLLALKAGEPRRLLRALTLDIGYTSADPAQDGRAQQLLALASSLAEQSEEANAHGLLQLCRGLYHYLQGRIALSNPHFESAIVTFETRCSGAVWESMTGHRFALATLFYLGRFKQLVQRVPPLLVEAESQGNLYPLTYLRSHFSIVAWLAGDEPTEARRHAAIARSAWNSPGFQLPHCSMLMGEMLIELYCDNLELAWEQLDAAWKQIERSHLLRVGIVKLQLNYLRGVLAAAMHRLAVTRQDLGACARLLLVARRSLQEVSSCGHPLALAQAQIIVACIAHAQGNQEAARGEMQKASDLLSREGLRLFAAAARARLAQWGAVPRERRHELLLSAQRAFEEEGVAEWQRMAQVLIPV